MKIYIETYGCALNVHDTLIMKHVLLSKGHKLIDRVDDADLVIINTCAVRLDTERKMQKRIREIARLNKRIIVTGCLAKARPYLVAKEFPNVSLVSPQNIHKIDKVVETNHRVILLEGRKNTSILPSIANSPTIATLAVSEGCLSNCSFCITKLARRHVVSYPIEFIVKTISKLVSNGVIEIRLTSQDIGVYGYDIYGKKVLPQLIRNILDNVKGKYRLRIGMMSPQHLQEFIDELVNLYKDDRLYKFIHLPVQSGDDRVLKLMNREYSVDEYRQLVRELRKKIPNIFIATDIIVGHPGEDEEAFMNTIDLVKELKFERVHIARYTYRPRTLSGLLKQIPESEKKRRSIVLSKIVEEIGLRKNSQYKGKIVEGIVLNTAFRETSLIARTNNYIPITIPNEYVGMIGKTVKIHVNDYTFFDLRGIPL